MATRERPTLDAVARRAGVSRATVSRVVNGSTSVAADIREAVNLAVAELGYVPNQAARCLVTQRTDAIALVLPGTAGPYGSDDLFLPAVIRGVGAELEAADKRLVLMMAGSAESHSRIERYAVAGHVDGVLFAAAQGADPLPGTLGRLGIPVVCGGRPAGAGEPPVPYVDVDHLGGAAAAVRHLVAAGRRRIATVAGPQDTVAGADRLAGYRAALAEAGLAEHVAFGDFTRDAGRYGMRRLLDEDPDLDAVFAACDTMAHGALTALREAGRRVPGDVAVIGFDDVESSRYSEPPLTTVRRPAGDVGRALARRLLALIDDEPGQAGAVVLPTELIIRGSA